MRLSLVDKQSVDFPLYAGAWVSQNLFIVGGGGGNPQFGVPNRIIVYRLVQGEGNTPESMRQVADMKCSGVVRAVLPLHTANHTFYVVTHSVIYALTLMDPDTEDIRISVVSTLSPSLPEGEGFNAAALCSDALITGRTDGVVQAWLRRSVQVGAVRMEMIDRTPLRLPGSHDDVINSVVGSYIEGGRLLAISLSLNGQYIAQEFSFDKEDPVVITSHPSLKVTPYSSGKSKAQPCIARRLYSFPAYSHLAAVDKEPIVHVAAVSREGGCFGTVGLLSGEVLTSSRINTESQPVALSGTVEGGYIGAGYSEGGLALVSPELGTRYSRMAQGPSADNTVTHVLCAPGGLSIVSVTIGGDVRLHSVTFGKQGGNSLAGVLLFMFLMLVAMLVLLAMRK
ncbi:hypothetical protein KIPB_000725 [Kipferlia bialata]|uniref:Uncharacterized protein n=1 Tax=Kipferlia bialata TaxID=797122 RepID=A0A9K3CPL2_9EUKA|nr:hypothetical protein KIPB_000725 [Kipferlia bialata]|eukprot:g725.t1